MTDQDYKAEVKTKRFLLLEARQYPDAEMSIVISVYGRRLVLSESEAIEVAEFINRVCHKPPSTIEHS